MTQTTPTTAKGGDASVLAALNAFAQKGSAYKETLREKLDDKRADKEKAAVASSPEGLYAILKSLKTVRVCAFVLSSLSPTRFWHPPPRRHS